MSGLVTVLRESDRPGLGTSTLRRKVSRAAPHVEAMFSPVYVKMCYMKMFAFAGESLYVITENSVNPAAARALSGTQASGYCCGALQAMIDWQQKRSSKVWPQNPFSETFVAPRRCPATPLCHATADQRSATQRHSTLPRHTLPTGRHGRAANKKQWLLRFLPLL